MLLIFSKMIQVLYCKTEPIISAYQLIKIHQQKEGEIEKGSIPSSLVIQSFFMPKFHYFNRIVLEHTTKLTSCILSCQFVVQTYYICLILSMNIK